MTSQTPVGVMHCKRFASSIAILLLTIMELINCRVCAGEDKCEKAIRDFQSKRERLSEYTSALREACDEGDLSLMIVFHDKIGRLLEELSRFREPPGCPGPEGRSALAPNTVKSESDAFEDKSCAELQRLRVQLLITVNSLERRQHSLFSQLSPEQKDELTRAMKDLAALGTAIKAKCPEESSSSRQRRPRVVPNIR
jgi:hypothetical protein